jgi:hypothetical protein
MVAPRQGPRHVQQWRDAIVKIAKKKMAHFVAVQNVLRFVGGPLNFDREDLPFRSEFYPFPFQLAPLDEVRLARYVVAEMPASPHIDSDLLADVIARATGGGQAINRVGALYDRILRLFAEEESLPDSVFRPDRVTGCRPRRLDSRPTWDAVRCLCERSMAGPMRCQCWPKSPANGRAKATSPTHISSPFVEIYDRWTLLRYTTGADAHRK